MAARKKKPIGTVAVPEKSEVAVLDDSQMWGDAGMGNEEVGADDIQIPTLVILQAMSPQLTKGGPAFVDGAEVGDLCNTLTNAVYNVEDEPLEAVCAHYRRRVVVMQDDGTKQGAFVATVDLDDPLALRPTDRQDFQGESRDCFTDDSGQYRIDVAEHYVILAESLEPILIRMKKTSMKASKRLNSRLQAYEPLVHPETGERKPRPRFGIRIGLCTKQETNKEGKPYLVWDHTVVGLNQDALLYNSAKQFCEAIKGGRVRADEPEVEAAPAASVGEDIPF